MLENFSIFPSKSTTGVNGVSVISNLSTLSFRRFGISVQSFIYHIHQYFHFVQYRQGNFQIPLSKKFHGLLIITCSLPVIVILLGILVANLVFNLF